MRAFFAAPVPGAARRLIADYASSVRGGERSGWVREENYHVTLRFLGEIEASSTRRIAGRVRSEVAACEAFEVTTGDALLLPTERRPRVFTLTLEPAASLSELAARVERGVTAAGLPPEPRAFRPHLTLARLRGGRRIAVEHRAPRARWRIDEVVFYESRFRRGGAQYQALDRLPLGCNEVPLPESS